MHESVTPGLQLCDPCDGHLTDRAGALLAVTTADCVPVFVVDPVLRVVGAAHAGWRGAAGGIVERAVRVMGASYGSLPADLYVHLGPAICGRCYEVGPEVFEGLGLPVPDAPTEIDLRAALVERLAAVGVPAGHVSVSPHCTRCEGEAGEDVAFFSHRGGDRER